MLCTGQPSPVVIASSNRSSVPDSYRVRWEVLDDGGLPITHYRIRIRPVCCLLTAVKMTVFVHFCIMFWFTTRQPFYGPFSGTTWVTGAKRELLDFMVQGEINRGRHTDHPAGCHSMRTNQCPPPPSPIFFCGLHALLPPNQQCQSTEGN